METIFSSKRTPELNFVYFALLQTNVAYGPALLQVRNTVRA